MPYNCHMPQLPMLNMAQAASLSWVANHHLRHPHSEMITHHSSLSWRVRKNLCDRGNFAQYAAETLQGAEHATVAISTRQPRFANTREAQAHVNQAQPGRWRAFAPL